MEIWYVKLLYYGYLIIFYFIFNYYTLFIIYYYGLNLTDIFPLVIGSLSRFELRRTELVLVYFSFVRFS